MTQEHSITPPPELVEKWEEQWCDMPVIRPSINSYMAAQAARWGADQGVEECCNWLYMNGYNHVISARLHAALRPEPPSLKEQALNDLDDIPTHDDEGRQVVDLSNIRRALEALDD